MEGELRERGFLADDRYSAADICLYGYVHCAEEGGFGLGGYPNVRRWRTAVRDQRDHVGIDEVGATFPPPKR